MILKCNEFELRRVTEDDLELLRTWRNKPEINSYMFNREYITPEMQHAWYSNLDQMKNWYFIFSDSVKDIGVIAITGIDWAKLDCTSNIFMGDEKFLGTPYPIFATYFVTLFGFYVLPIRLVRSRVISHNKNAIGLNRFFGFEIGDYVMEGGYYPVTTTPEQFAVHEPRLTGIMRKYFRQDTLKLDLIIDGRDAIEVTTFLRKCLENMSDEHRQYFRIYDRG